MFKKFNIVNKLMNKLTLEMDNTLELNNLIKLNQLEKKFEGKIKKLKKIFN